MAVCASAERRVKGSITGADAQWWMAEAPGGTGLPARTRVSMGLVIPPPRTMSTLAISMIASAAGSIPVVSMSMTRINRRGLPPPPQVAFYSARIQNTSRPPSSSRRLAGPDPTRGSVREIGLGPGEHRMAPAASPARPYIFIFAIFRMTTSALFRASLFNPLNTLKVMDPMIHTFPGFSRETGSQSSSLPSSSRPRSRSNSFAISF